MELRFLAMGLIIVGAPLGMYLNFYLYNIGWNNILMFCALLALPNWGNLMEFRLPFANKTFRDIIIFQFLCISYMIVGGQIDISGLIYMIFTIFLVVGIMSNRIEKMAMRKIVHYSWIFGWICLVFCALSLGTGIYFIEFAKSHDGSGYQSILIDLTMAGNLYTFIVCCLYFLDSDKTRRALSILGIILSILFIFILGKRTPLLVSGVAVVFYTMRFHPISRRIKKSFFKYLVIFVLLLIILSQVPGLLEQVQTVFERTIGGIYDMLNGTSSSGKAAVERYKLRNWAFDYIDNNFSIFNYIFGAGYMTKWLDAPMLQAYLDMGIIGFIVYFYYVIVKPLKITFSKLSLTKLVFWGCALNFYNILSALNSGTPYSHLKWIPLIILLLTVETIKCEKRYTAMQTCKTRQKATISL